MLDREYNLLLNRLGPTRGAETRFFAFADTVATRNFKGDNEQHGWMGVRFQSQPGQPPSDILLHVNLRDTTAQLQQEALGILGVNLVYAASHQSDSADTFFAGIFDGLSISRVELDVLELSGPKFEKEDARLWSLQSLRRTMAHAIVFDSASHIVEPSSVLRKRALLVERGRFDPVQEFQREMLLAAERQIKTEETSLSRDPSAVLEMTIHHAAGGEPIDPATLLPRVAQVAGMGPVVISNYPQSYLLVDYLRRYTDEPIRMVMGIATLAQILHEGYYDQLPGRLLEGLGRFLATNVKVYAYPMPAELFRKILGKTMDGTAPASGDVTLDNYLPGPPLDHLYRYLRDAGWVIALSV